MSYSIIPTPDFKIAFKRLAKKHKSLKNDIAKLGAILQKKPNQGTDLGSGVFKIRIAIESKGKGKSGGARVITYVVTEDKEIYLTYIYDKADISNITKKQIQTFLKNAGLK